MAYLSFTYGAMRAGKTAHLLQMAFTYKQSGFAIMLWASGLLGSTPDGEIGEIRSRMGQWAHANLFHDTTDMAQAIETRHASMPLGAVFIDEAQCLSRHQVWQLADVCDHLGLPVFCYGLRTDFRGELFEGANALLALADRLEELTALCHCGQPARMSARLDVVGNITLHGPQIELDQGQYVPLCREHWRVAMSKALAKPATVRLKNR